MMRSVRKIFLTVFLSYLCLLLGLYFVQRQMVYFPDKTKPDITPYAVMGVEEKTISTADGFSLSGWFKAAEAGQKTVLFFHGNASHYGTRIFKAAPYLEAGYGALLVGYRGYGGNAGSPSEQGLYEDARAWIKALLAQGVREEDIILYGESLGTGVAVQMALEFPNIHALILESPYTSLPDVAANTYFFIPVHLLMKDKFASLDKIEQISTPLFIIQGMQDTLIPPAHGQALFNAAPAPKDILKLEGYGHNDMPPKEIFKGVDRFLKNQNL